MLEVKGRDPLHQMRLAWHLGNRHLETEIGPKWLRIRQDHVIADMLKGLGAKVVEIEGPFQPEGGAYQHETHADMTITITATVVTITAIMVTVTDHASRP